jgi:hypothetical protein
MRRITKAAAIAATALTALTALGSAAGASVNVNPDGVGTIGKGDVQTALGYANDAAFQADAKNITFSLGSDVTNMVADIKCSALNVMGPDDPFDVAHNVYATTTTTHTPAVTALRNGAGKVTGYAATGITDGTPTTVYYSSNWATCPAGEHFMGWLNGPSNAFHWETVPGTGVLQVSNGVKTVDLPNTPVAPTA